jgi:hypothetical protein
MLDREYQNAIAEFEESVKELHAEWKNSCLVSDYTLIVIFHIVISG